MSLFGNNTPKSKTRTYHHRQPKTIRQMLSDAFARQLKNNPELMDEAARQFGANDLGIKFTSKAVDPIAAQRDNINKTITDAALQVINEDEDLKRRLAEEKAKELLGIKSISRHSNNNSEEPIYLEDEEDPVDKLVSLMDKFKKLKGVLEVDEDKGILGGLIDKEVLKAVAPQLLSLFFGKLNPNGVPSQRVIIVQNENGQLVEIPEEQYNSMVSQGLIKPAAMIKSPTAYQGLPPVTPPTVGVPGDTPKSVANLPTVPQPESPKVDSQPSPTEEPVKVDFGFFDIDCLPKDYVSELNESCDSGNDDAIAIKTFLGCTDYDSIVKMVLPYKGNPDVKDQVEKIMSPQGKTWFEEVMNLLNKPIGA